MHELSICQALILQLEQIAQQHQAKHIDKIVLRVGVLAGVEPALLEKAYPLASIGTVAENATLIIENTPITIQCLSCHAQTPAEPNRLICGVCGSWQTKLLSGNELLLAQVELITE